MLVDLFLTGLLQGLILALVTYGVMISFRLLNFPDLTAEGAYPLGGAICASALISGLNPVVALLLSTLFTGTLGLATGLIHLRLKVNTLLAGIIVSTMAYSLNLRIMAKPNISLFNTEILFNQNSIIFNIVVIVIIMITILLPLTFFLRTEIGLRFRAVGINPIFAKKQSISVAKYTLFGLFIASSYSGLAGGLMVQLQLYMDIGMGIGIVIHALAALMIGETIIGNHTINRQLFAPLIGALIYQQIQGLILFSGLAPADLKFLTGAIMLTVIAIRKRGCDA